MYYLNSRFYHPSLRRFITMDDVNYLDKLNVSNLNLYNYSKNNPIAQYIYSSYLYNNVKKEDESNYFEGNRFDIMGEWQAHNAAYWGMKVVSLFSKDFANSLAGIANANNYEDFLNSAKTVNFGPSIELEERGIVRLVSSILSDINEKYFGLIERTIYILCNINF